MVYYDNPPLYPSPEDGAIAVLGNSRITVILETLHSLVLTQN